MDFFSYESLQCNVDLEGALCRSVDEAALLEMGIPKSCIPKLTGKLPRLYHKSSSHLEKVKDHFSYLPALKRHYVEKALFSLYSQHEPSPETKIILFTWVIQDGYGDYTSQIQAAHILQSALPQVQITLITLYHKDVILPLINHQIPHYRVPYTALGVWNRVVYENFSQEIKMALYAADFVFQIPTFFPHTKDVLSFVSPHASYELMGEGGWIDTPHFHPLTNTHCLGLNFLEKGIWIQKKAKHPIKISNTKLILALFEKTPTEEEIKDYFLKHHLNLCYVRHHPGLYLYMYSLLKGTEYDLSDLDIVVSPLHHFLAHFEEEYRPLLQKFQIKKVVIYYKEHRSEVQIQTSGKTLKLIETSLSHDDFLQLISLSSHLVGCRGDGSIFETISASQIPFFDISYHQKKFLNDLISLAKFYIPDYPEAIEYLTCFLRMSHLRPPDTNSIWKEEPEEPTSYSLNMLGEKLGTFLQNPKTTQGIRILCEQIQKEHSCNEFIVHLTQRALCHRKHPHMKILESLAMDSFFHGDQSLEQSLKEVQKELSILRY